MIGLRHQSPSALFPIAGATGGRLWQGALLVTALYLLVLAAGWTINIPAGHEGILRIAPAETQPGALEIVEVAAGSPAAMAGLKTGDLLLAMNGFTMMEGEAVHQSLHERRAGGALRLRVQRLETDGAAPRYGAPEDLTLTLVSQLAVPGVVVD
jgi:membrane-associated protease RseP (regulator of RpoE activity)